MEEKKIENVTQGAGTAGGSWYDNLGNKPKDAAYINKMYDGSLESQKQTLTQNYDTGVSDIAASAEKQRKATDANLNRTYVESAKAAKNYGEVQNAYGLTSGAMAQARLAQDNQLQADLTALRAAQTDSDAQFERQRNLLAKEYSAAIAKAQADNDYQRAQALYNAAKADEDQLMQMQKEAGNLMAGVGDYSILAKLYGLTDEQLALLMQKYGGGGGSGGGGGGGYYSRRSGGGSGGGSDDGSLFSEAEVAKAAIGSDYGNPDRWYTAGEANSYADRLLTAANQDAVRKEAAARNDAVLAGNKAGAATRSTGTAESRNKQYRTAKTGHSGGGGKF